LARTVFATWEPVDIHELVRLMQKFANAMKQLPIDEQQ